MAGLWKIVIIGGLDDGGGGGGGVTVLGWIENKSVGEVVVTS